MRSWRSEPYLWVHLAGIATVPIFIELCLLGLAASELSFPPLLVFLLVAVAGISPIFWMQWQRPFYIFSLSPLVLKPAQLTETQCQLLRRFKAPLGRVLALVMAIVAIVLLWQLQQWVPITTPAAKIVPGGALGGLLLAMGAFLLSNLFLQVPASVLAVLVTPGALLRKTEPYPVNSIASDFSLLGMPVKQILPPVAASTSTPPTPVAPPVTSVISGGGASLTESSDAHSSSAPDRTVDPEPTVSLELEPEIVEALEANSESEIVINLEDQGETHSQFEVKLNSEAENGAEPNAELSSESAEKTGLETKLELEVNSVPKIELTLKPIIGSETGFEPEDSLDFEPELISKASSEAEIEPATIGEVDRPIDPEIRVAMEQEGWDNPEPELVSSEQPTISPSNLIEAETVEEPIEAETVADSEAKTTEESIEILATLENPIAISARLEDPIEAASPANPFEEAAADLSKIEDIDLPNVQDTLVSIILDVGIPNSDLAAGLPLDLLIDSPIGAEHQPNVEDTIVVIIPNAAADQPLEENM